MDDLFVDGNAHLARKLSIPKKGASGAIMLHASRREIIDLPGGHPRLDERRNLVQYRACHRAGRPHRFHIPFAFENDHLQQLCRWVIDDRRGPSVLVPSSTSIISLRTVPGGGLSLESHRSGA